MKSIHNIIAAQAQLSPQAEVILDFERSPLTYAQLYQHLQTTQQAFNNMGLRRGDRLAIVLPNGPEMATAFLTAAPEISPADRFRGRPSRLHF